MGREWHDETREVGRGRGGRGDQIAKGIVCHANPWKGLKHAIIWLGLHHPGRDNAGSAEISKQVFVMVQVKLNIDRGGDGLKGSTGKIVRRPDLQDGTNEGEGRSVPLWLSSPN